MMMNSPTYSNLREEVTRGHLDIGKFMIVAATNITSE